VLTKHGSFLWKPREAAASSKITLTLLADALARVERRQPFRAFIDSPGGGKSAFPQVQSQRERRREREFLTRTLEAFGDGKSYFMCVSLCLCVCVCVWKRARGVCEKDRCERDRERERVKVVTSTLQTKENYIVCVLPKQEEEDKTWERTSKRLWQRVACAESPFANPRSDHCLHLQSYDLIKH